MKNIIWNRPDGGIAITSITTPPTLAIVKQFNPTISEEEAEKLLKLFLENFPKDSKEHAEQLQINARKDFEGKIKTNPKGAPFIPAPEILEWEAVAFDLPLVDIPTGNFDNARCWKNGRIEYDMEKVREIHLGRLREKRSQILPKLDVEWMRAVAKKDFVLAEQIESKRETLRVMPQTVKLQLDAASTPDDVEIIVPASLSEK